MIVMIVDYSRTPVSVSMLAGLPQQIVSMIQPFFFLLLVGCVQFCMLSQIARHENFVIGSDVGTPVDINTGVIDSLERAVASSIATTSSISSGSPSDILRPVVI